MLKSTHVRVPISEKGKKKKKKVQKLWKDIQEQIGEAKKWSIFIRRLFWTPNINHWERCLIAAFVYVNGLNPDMFEEWAKLQGLGRDDADYRHLHVLFRLFRDRHYKLYAWHLGNSRYEYIDGTIRRYYVHKTLRKNFTK